VPSVDTNCPATHVVHDAQLAAFTSALNVPVAQPAHTWSVVALPGADTYSPTAHSVHAVQPGASPVAENVPAGQAEPPSKPPPSPASGTPVSTGPPSTATSSPPQPTALSAASARNTRSVFRASSLPVRDDMDGILSVGEIRPAGFDQERQRIPD
jgi:hypothetical protein